MLLIQMIKARLKGITLLEQLHEEKQRLESLENELKNGGKDIEIIRKQNYLTFVRDVYGFGNLKRSVRTYLAHGFISVVGFYLTNNIAFVLGLSWLPSLGFIVGAILLFKYPVTKEYWLR